MRVIAVAFLLGGFSLAASCLATNPLPSDLGDLFVRIDANADGQLTAEEISTPGKSLYKRLLRVYDKNKDGKLSQDEFDAGLSGGQRFEMSMTAETGGPPGRTADRRPNGDMQANLQRLIANLDRDKNGKISEDEAPPRLKANFKQLDRDSDGELDRREMGAAMMQMRPAGMRQDRAKPDAAKPEARKPGAGEGKPRIKKK